MRRLRSIGILSAVVGALASAVALLPSSKPVEAAAYRANPVSTEITYVQRAITSAGIQPSRAAVFWDDFEYQINAAAMAKWVQSQSGTGGYVSGGGDDIGWWVTVSTGATAGSSTVPGGGNPLITNSTTKRWYIAARFKVATAVDAQAVVAVGMDEGTNSVMIGVVGGLSTTNFVVQHSGLRTGTAISLSAIDTSTHVFEMWSPGTAQICGRMDGGAVSCGTQTTAVALSPYQRIWVQNGTTAANRAMHVDWFIAATERSN